MEPKIAFCGIPCAQCPTYLATQQDDDAARQRVADEWSAAFGMTLTAADIDCDGCQTAGGRLFGHCAGCAVRSCGQERGVENCSACVEFATCETVAQQRANLPKEWLVF